MNMFMPRSIAIRATCCWRHAAHSNQPNLWLYSLWQKHLWQKYEGQKNAVGSDVRDDDKQWLVSSSIFLPNIFLP